MRRQLLSLAAVILTGGLLATPSASAQQSVNFFVGGFVPTPLDARGATASGRDDILVKDLDVFGYRFDRFHGMTFGGEYLAGLGDFFEAGASLGYYQSTVPATDINFVNTNGSDINADLKLRTVPFTATFRVLPLGHRAPIVPYVGAGVGVTWFRYSESGQFVDYPLTGPLPRNPAIFNGTFSSTGSAAGPVVLGGFRVPIGPMEPGFEIRWQSMKGDLDTSQFAAQHIDLGGMSYLFTFAIRF